MNLTIEHTRTTELEIDVEKFKAFFKEEYDEWLKEKDDDEGDYQFIRHAMDMAGLEEYTYQSSEDDGVKIVDQDDEWMVYPL